MKCPHCSEDLSCYYCEKLINFEEWHRITINGKDIQLFGTRESIDNLGRLIASLSRKGHEIKT